MSPPEHEKTWRDFWEPVVSGSDGMLDLDKIKRELYDYRILLTNASKVYDHVTGGLLSKTNYDASVVITAADDYQTKLIDGILSEERHNQ